MDKKQTIHALDALSQETRLDVFRLLVKAGPQGLYARDIADGLGVLQNTLSTHLAILERSQLVLKEREGRNIRYRANYEGMRGLLFYLMNDCCGCKLEDINTMMEKVFPDCCTKEC